MNWTNKRILVIGGDQRLLFLANFLKDSCRQVQTYALEGGEGLCGAVCAASLEEAMQNADIIVAPVPFTKDGIHLLTKDNTIVYLTDFCANLKQNQVLFGGNISKVVLEAAKEKNVVCYDFMKMEDVAMDNAITTAEGAIAEAITLSKQNINQEVSLILGYGRCAKAIAQRLKGMNAKVIISARRLDARQEALAEGYGVVSLEDLASCTSQAQFIFNTIPTMMLDARLIEIMHPDAVIIDIASAPGGTDFDACKKKGITAKLSLGLPGRYSPKTSAKILLRGMMSSLE
ncbi:dipicolinate synthase subunit DpsA [Anaerotignum sp.]|uniref:dipicolinate synthase subunit DpsA n=1 Tax=Anaerotignum sp. TaxID=2039241 RepID=UPI0033318059